MHSWIHYKDFCLTMKNSGGQFFPLHAITCSADNEMEDWHHHISTWKAQLKDQELLEIQLAWWPLCTPGWNPSANTQIQVVIARKLWCVSREGATGCQDTEMEQVWWATPKVTPGRAALLFKLCQRTIGALPSTQTPSSTLAVKMIWLLFFKNVILLPTVKNIFVISCWFCWSSGNSFASEILEG